MSKIFAGELAGELLAGGELAAATGGMALPFEFLALGVQGMILGIHHHKQKKKEEEQRNAIDEANR